jgi:tripartite ATP-independent transporter DctP family solute receptor
MSKKVFYVLLVLVLGISLVAAGCSSSQPAEKKQGKTTLRLGHEMPEDHPYHLGAKKFGDLLAQKTNGRYEVVIYPNGQLGKQKQLAEMCASDQLDFALAWQGILEAFDPNTGVISLPFIFRDWNHVYKTVDGPIGNELFKGVEKKGIKVVTNFNNGLYNIVSTKEIKNPEDLKGIKLRVQPSKVFTDTGEMMGAVVTPMAFGEVYSALQLKAIDAQIQGAINVRKSKHFEVAKYTCENHINYLLEPLIMNLKTFNKMTPEDQKALQAAANEAAAWQRADAEKTEAADAKYLQENGMKYYKADIAAWQKATAPVYDKYGKWKELVDKIKSVK